MKIRFADDPGKKLTGTPIDIVQKMRSLCHQPSETLEEYIRGACERSLILGTKISYSGSNDEERCLLFMVSMVKDGFAKIDLDEMKSPDRFAITVIRKALDLSQERFAEQLGVSYTTVNRWERGRNQPRSMVHIRNIIKIASQLHKW